MTTALGSRRLAVGRRVSQGTREYFDDILREMRARGEGSTDIDLADKLEDALDEGKLDYIVVKGNPMSVEVDPGVTKVWHGGYDTRKFNIGGGERAQ